MPSHILHCSSSRSLDRHNKLQCNKTKVQTNVGYLHETNALHTVFCTVEYRSKKHFHAPPKQSCNNQISSGAVANSRSPCLNKLYPRIPELYLRDLTVSRLQALLRWLAALQPSFTATYTNYSRIPTANEGNSLSGRSAQTRGLSALALDHTCGLLSSWAKASQAMSTKKRWVISRLPSPFQEHDYTWEAYYSRVFTIWSNCYSS